MDGCTLLLVDDDATLISSLTRAIRGLRGLHVVSATSSAKARSIARERAINAAVVDLLLGPESGVELVAQLRRLHPQLPIAAATGAASNALIDAATAAGATAVLRKPFTVAQAAHVLGIEHPELRQSLHVEHATLERAKWEHVQRVYADLGNNVRRTARVLGITRTTLKTELAKPRPRS